MKNIIWNLQFHLLSLYSAILWLCHGLASSVFKENRLSGENHPLTLPMLRQLFSKAQGCKDCWKPSKPCHLGIHWIALTEYSLMSTHVPGFQSFSAFLHHFVLAKLTTSSTRVKLQVTPGNFLISPNWDSEPKQCWETHSSQQCVHCMCVVSWPPYSNT